MPNITFSTNTDIPQQVLDHISAMTVPTQDGTSKCVDGGYRDGEAEGQLARPGADLGVSMALLAQGFTPAEAFHLVYDYRLANGGTYGFHTDTHVEPADGSEPHNHDKVSGCGHCQAAIDQGSVHYGVKNEDVKELLDIINAQYAKAPETMTKINLDRDHAEQGVLVVTSTDWTVKPWNGAEGGEQYFIYDAIRDQTLLEAIVAFGEESERHVNLDALKKAVEDQTNATLGLLGSSKGKPLYQVSISDTAGQKTVSVELVGHAPVLA